MIPANKPRILFFIGSLRSGGKERRLVELLTYLKEKDVFEILLVMTKNEIHYRQFHNLRIDYQLISKRWKRNDPTVVWEFYKIARKFDPDIIHVWGRMQSLYSIPAVLFGRKPLINSQITGAPVKLNRWSLNRLIDRLNFRFSKLVLANSLAGLQAFRPPAHKQQIIYNGINLNRFNSLPPVEETKMKYGIKTPYAVVMIASYTTEKNYGLFFEVASRVTSFRNDVSFIGAGGFDRDDRMYRELVSLTHASPRIMFHTRTNEVEALVNACDIGVLFSTNGEGISNAILEYMALGKPVIATNAGGTPELITDRVNGYLLDNGDVETISQLISGLLDDPGTAAYYGANNKRKIAEKFTLDCMGKAFESVYQKILDSNQFTLC